MIKIIGTLKSKFHSFYILEKKQEFFAGFRKFLVDMGVGAETGGGNEDTNVEIYSFGRPFDKDGEPIVSEEDNIGKYIDLHYSYKTKKYFIDLVFGKEKIFLVVFSKDDYQQEIQNNLGKFCRF